MKLTPLLLPLVLAIPALGQSNFNYTYIEATYEVARYNDDYLADRLDTHGVGLSASMELANRILLKVGVANARTTTDNDRTIDSRSLRLGIGTYVPVNDRVDLVGDLGFSSASVGSGFDENDFGIDVSFGIRALLIDDLELYAGLDVTFFDAETFYTPSIGLLYNFTPSFSGLLAAGINNDSTLYGVGIRYSF